jgi:hypothetical protein
MHLFMGVLAWLQTHRSFKTPYGQCPMFATKFPHKQAVCKLDWCELLS